MILVISHFGFKGGTLVPIASVPGHCLPFAFFITTLPMAFFVQRKRNGNVLKRVLHFEKTLCVVDDNPFKAVSNICFRDPQRLAKRYSLLQRFAFFKRYLQKSWLKWKTDLLITHLYNTLNDINEAKLKCKENVMKTTRKQVLRETKSPMEVYGPLSYEYVHITFRGVLYSFLMYDYY